MSSFGNPRFGMSFRWLALTVALLEQSARSFAQSACIDPSGTAATRKELSSLYTDLLSSPNASAWPDADAHKKLWRGLEYDADGRVQPRTFSKDGPLQIVLYLQQSADALDLVAQAREKIFEPFLAELREGLSKATLDVIDRGVFVPKADALHTVVLVFSEHPSLLDDDERAKWQPVGDQKVEELGEALKVPIETRCAIRLQLWGYAITPDGSMLMLFEEASGGGGSSLLSLREQLAAVGEQKLGALNSRPKKLVHVSSMRMLDWPFGRLSGAEDRHVQAVIRKWTSALAAHRLPDGSPLPNVNATFDAEQLQLARDMQWMMTRHQTYRKYQLLGRSAAELDGRWALRTNSMEHGKGRKRLRARNERARATPVH